MDFATFVRQWHLPISSIVLAVWCLASPVFAQCDHEWHSLGGLAGVDGTVRATLTWDPDGGGPATPIWIVAGDFGAAGAAFQGHIAAFDPATSEWRSLGTGMDAPVFALAALPNGDLVAAGSFTTAGSAAANRVARWDGTTWTSLGTGLGGMVNALAVLSNGDLVAGGSFTTAGAGSTILNRVARWDGSTWSPLGAGLTQTVSSLAVEANGNLLAGEQGIWRWNGAAWSQVSPYPLVVQCLATHANGGFVAGGIFALALPGIYGIAQWNGSSWSALGGGLALYLGTMRLDGDVTALRRTPNGDLLAVGRFAVPGSFGGSSVARWNGSTWTALPGLIGSAKTVDVMPNGALVVGGQSMQIASLEVDGIARWTGNGWTTLGNGLTGYFGSVARLRTGDVVLGGTSIERWSNGSWTQLVGPNPNMRVNAMTTLANGDLVVAATTSSIGGVPINGIARWNGTTWSGFGSGLTSSYQGIGIAHAIVELPQGDLLVGGSFELAGGVVANGIAHWNGNTWSAFGPGLVSPSWPVDPTIRSIAILANGDVVVAGTFPAAAGSENIARWNGTSWSPLGTGLNSTVHSIVVSPGGDIVAGGSFVALGGPANHVARWNGVTWSQVGQGLPTTVYSLHVLPDGDLVARTAGALHRWDGANWSLFAPAMAAGNGLPELSCATTTANGDLLVCGRFSTAGDVVSSRVARLTSTCPATAVASGSGCTGSGGPNVLEAVTLPWIGSTFHTRATGMPPNGLAFRVLGFDTGAVPLAALLPEGAPGCSLYVALDLVDLVLPVSGVVRTDIAIPDALILVGATAHQQVVPVEFDTTGVVTALTATNRLSSAIGAF